MIAIPPKNKGWLPPPSEGYSPEEIYSSTSTVGSKGQKIDLGKHEPKPNLADQLWSIQVKLETLGGLLRRVGTIVGWGFFWLIVAILLS